MAVYLIGNCQFGRASVIEENKRPFENILDMNEEMIQRWNAVVTENDDVIHIGNFAWDPSTAEEVLGKLNGRKIHLLPAEYDHAVLDLQARGMLPSNSVISNRIYEQKKLKATLAYWPLLEWPAKKQGHYLYYGYYDKKYKPDHKKKMINMACEFWNYTPHKIDSLLKLFTDKDVQA